MMGRGLCECGCGKTTSIVVKTSKREGYVAGEHRRFVVGHSGNHPQNLTRYEVQDNGCWNWTGAMNTNGYGQIQVNGEGTSAHRAMWEHMFGIDLPRHLHVDHLCRNKVCINPSHMEVTTVRTNTRRRSSTVLTPEIAEQIRQWPGRPIDAAREFGISDAKVATIRAGLEWAPDDTSEADYYNNLARERAAS